MHVKRSVSYQTAFNWLCRGIAFGLAYCIALLANDGVHYVRETYQYAQAGRVACSTPINYSYLKRCNPTADGIACMHESQTVIEDYVVNINYRCGQIGPSKPFVFPVPDSPDEAVLVGG